MASSYIYNLGVLFYEVSKNYALRTALRYPDGSSVDFETLNKRSNQIANFLLSANLERGSVLAIFNNKSVDSFATMIACLKTGVVYTNLDPASPLERTTKILGTCQPKMIIFAASPAYREQLVQAFTDPLYFDLADIGEKLDKQDAQDLLCSWQTTGADPAYIMFTSGSTGFPKGALMSHSNVLNFIRWGQSTFEINETDVCTNVNPIYFDNSVFDFYVTVFSGACLVPLRLEEYAHMRDLVNAVDELKCTSWFSVPSLLVYLLTTKSLTAKSFQFIRQIIFGGEGFPKVKLRELFNLFSDRIRLYNVYGPTECTCICSCYLIKESDFEDMNVLAPLGYLAPNYSYEILGEDADRGELALIGPCVGLGYFNDTERTEKSFINNPKRKYLEKMYRTGDLVERDNKGLLHFKGRADNQIKHLGYRIELEEVEAGFNSLPYVDEVGVIYEKISPELGQIKAFVRVGSSVSQDQIKNDIARVLPAYMLPKRIIFLDQLPKNSNGKIDRKQLTNLVAQ